ncbi:ATP-binding protein [Croceimicrobium sp.]|uniref:ATP-binding protein n=1 Tax=Croceimicrobium sp. TaxID=2828340 RepID=UPI003BA8B178
MPKNIAIADLRDQFESLAGLPDEQIDFLIQESELVEYPQDSFLFRSQEPANNMTFVLKGHFKVFLNQNGNQVQVTELRPGEITGILPFSRMEKATASAQASEDSLALQFPRAKMRTLINQHYELTENLVHLMNSRIRTFTTIRQQNERMMALGKLAAGLAHELNNPTSAIARSAQVLNSKGDKALEMVKKVIALPNPVQYLEMAERVLLELKSKEQIERSLLQRQDMEDDWQDYLEDQGLPNCGDLIDNLVNYDVDPSFLEKAFQSADEEAREALLQYLEFELSRQELQNDIVTAASRISELVASIKNFTHMDQAQDKSPDSLAKSLDSTLKMLDHKIRKEGIKVIKDYDPDLVKVPIWAGQMNQVFTNLLDNAIDALKDSSQPEIRIKTFSEHGNAFVHISDNGPGIPEDLQSMIFDPFYTTKGVGEGTGMGLEISRRIVEQHQGKLQLLSNASPTLFSICLPL